jgi:lauroyl/myristoyl acyltransferase
MAQRLKSGGRGPGDRLAAGRPALVRRAVKKPERPLITAKDVAILLWLCVGAAAAPLPRAWRWRLCRFAAHFASRTRRGRDARACALRIGKIPADDVERVIQQLYAGRLAAHLDVVRALLLGPDVRAQCRGLAEIDAALAQGHGVVLWISDFVSAGDVSKIALANAGYRVTHLSRKEHGFSTSAFGIRFLNPLRIRFESAYLEERVVFDRTDPAPAMSRLLARLRANGIVSIVASMHEGGTLVDLPFLAGRLKIALGALRLARVSGAAVIPVFLLRENAEAFEAVFAAPLTFSRGSRETEVLAPASEYRDLLEAYVRARPECWVGWRRAGQLAESGASQDCALTAPPPHAPRLGTPRSPGGR